MKNPDTKTIGRAAGGGLCSRQHRGGIPQARKADKARYMNLAEGSLEECRYYLILAQDLAYGDTTQLTTALEEVSRMLNAYATDSRQQRHRVPSGNVFLFAPRRSSVFGLPPSTIQTSFAPSGLVTSM
jgi:23S rRNA-intervening sequence protein